jgi:hypothetical protein
MSVRFPHEYKGRPIEGVVIAICAQIDLRFFQGCQLLSGHNIGDVSYQLGHSSIKITYDTYGHWLPGKFKSEVDELDSLHPAAPYPHPNPDISKNVVSIQKVS